MAPFVRLKPALVGVCFCVVCSATGLVWIPPNGEGPKTADRLIRDEGLGCNELHPDVLIYNRVPKSGSSTMKLLLDELSVANGFEFTNSPEYHPEAGALSAHFKRLCTTARRCVYVNHMRYPPVEALQVLTQRNLTYAMMNVIRRPVAQKRSAYEYARFGDRQRWKNVAAQQDYNSSFIDCVHELDQACVPTNVYFRYFSDRIVAQHKRLDGTTVDRALLNAVVNIKTYAVIGILEQWQESLAVFEKVLPDFFRGAAEMQARMEMANQTPKVSHAAKEMFASDLQDAKRILYHSRFSLENSVYDYVSTRFMKQFEACDIFGVEHKVLDSFLFELE